jgi:hypothetical protein
MPTPTDGTLFTTAWRIEAELFCGTETFRNHFDIRSTTGLVTTPPDPTHVAVEDYLNFLTTVYYPDVTLNSVFLRNIYKYTTAPPHVDHPPIWETSPGTPGTGNTTFGGTHNTNYLPQEVCIYCKKVCSGGRNGKLFMRNILTEVDVQSAIGGFWAFSPGSGHFDPTVFNAAAVSVLGPALHGGADAAVYELCVTHLEHTSPTDTRPITTSACTVFEAVRPTWNRSTR